MHILPSAPAAAQEKQIIKIHPGMQFRVRGLHWSADWEFDCPTAIISPVYRFYEDGCSLEYAVEDLMIDACVLGTLKGHDPKLWSEFRGWTPEYLRRKFYRPYVQNVDLLVTIFLDERGKLSWTEQPHPKARAKNANR